MARSRQARARPQRRSPRRRAGTTRGFCCARTSVRLAPGTSRSRRSRPRVSRVRGPRRRQASAGEGFEESRRSRSCRRSAKPRAGDTFQAAVGRRSQQAARVSARAIRRRVATRPAERISFSRNVAQQRCGTRTRHAAERRGRGTACEPRPDERSCAAPCTRQLSERRKLSRRVVPKKNKKNRTSLSSACLVFVIHVVYVPGRTSHLCVTSISCAPKTCFDTSASVPCPHGF